MPRCGFFDTGGCSDTAIRDVFSFADGVKSKSREAEDMSDSDFALRLARAYVQCPASPPKSPGTSAPKTGVKIEECRAYFKRMLVDVILEYKAFVAQAQPGPLDVEVYECDKNKYRAVDGAEKLEQFNNSLVILNGVVSLATHNQEEDFIRTHGGGSIRVAQKHRLTGKRDAMREVGYVGSYVNDMAALMLQARCCSSDLGRGLWALGRVPAPVGFAPAPDTLCASVPISAAQDRAVREIGHVFELVHGPPGTGKSTTIFHIVHARAARDAVSIVTAIQNKAIDALAEKFARTFADMPFVVDGNPKRLGPVAAEYTLKAQVERHEYVRVAREEADRLSRIVDRLFKNQVTALLCLQEEEGCARIGSARRQARMRAAYDLARRDRERVAQLRDIALAGVDAARESADAELRSDMRVFICTIDLLSGNILRGRCGWERPTCMIVIDEAGCVPEYKVAALTISPAHNIVAVGDDKQLPPFTNLDDVQHSFYKRAKKCNVPEHRLTEQFRMHPRICNLVSGLFYSDTLTTHADTVVARQSPLPLVWIDGGNHTEERDGTSYTNSTEASLAVDAAARAPEGSVAILTFYRAQAKLVCALLDKRGMPYNDEAANLRVATVDAAQGSEADTVILSCVRANGTGAVGFTANKYRMCVALSRARERLVVVGNAQTLRGSRLWENVYKACTRATTPRDAFAAPVSRDDVCSA